MEVECQHLIMFSFFIFWESIYLSLKIIPDKTRLDPLKTCDDQKSCIGHLLSMLGRCGLSFHFIILILSGLNHLKIWSCGPVYIPKSSKFCLKFHIILSRPWLEEWEVCQLVLIWNVWSVQCTCLSVAFWKFLD